MVFRVIAEGHIDPKFARSVVVDAGLGSGGSDSSRRLDEDFEEKYSGELGTLRTLLQKAMTALKRAKEGADGAEGGARRMSAASPKPRRPSPPSSEN